MGLLSTDGPRHERARGEHDATDNADADKLRRAEKVRGAGRSGERARVVLWNVSGTFFGPLARPRVFSC